MKHGRYIDTDLEWLGLGKKKPSAPKAGIIESAAVAETTTDKGAIAAFKPKGADDE